MTSPRWRSQSLDEQFKEHIHVELPSAERIMPVVTDQTPSRLPTTLLIRLAKIGPSRPNPGRVHDAVVAVEFATLHHFLHAIPDAEQPLRPPVSESVYASDATRRFSTATASWPMRSPSCRRRYRGHRHHSAESGRCRRHRSTAMRHGLPGTESVGFRQSSAVRRRSVRCSAAKTGPNSQKSIEKPDGSHAVLGFDCLRVSATGPPTVTPTCCSNGYVQRLPRIAPKRWPVTGRWRHSSTDRDPGSEGDDRVAIVATRRENRPGRTASGNRSHRGYRGHRSRCDHHRGNHRVTREKIARVLAAYHRCSIPVFLEPITPETVNPADELDGFFLPTVFNAVDRTWIVGTHAAGANLLRDHPWDRTIPRHTSSSTTPP